MPDVTVENHGSVYVLRLHSSAARAWRLEYLPEDAPSIGTNSVAVETRYVADILEGMISDGLEVE